MSKYVKLEDAMEVHRRFAINGRLASNVVAEYNNLPTIEIPTCSECEHYEDHHTSLACAKYPVITKSWEV